MAMATELAPGTGLTWTGPACPDPPVSAGERGVFVGYDGRGPDDGYVVSFRGGRHFCCRRSDVTPDPRPDHRVTRRHRGQ